MTKPVVIIVGANKGGVGKTLVTRTLLDYLQSNGIDYRPFDTESPQGDLKRFYPRAEVVDLADSDGQIAVFDTLGDAVTVIDIRAGLLTKTLETLSEIGFINPEKYTVIVLHVIENSEVSISEMQALTDHIAGVRYVVVANSKNGAKFDFALPAGAIEIPMLDASANRAVDAASQTFSAYVKSGVSVVRGGKVNHWLGLVFARFASVKLP